MGGGAENWASCCQRTGSEHGASEGAGIRVKVSQLFRHRPPWPPGPSPINHHPAQALCIKEVGTYVSELRRVGKGHPVFHFDRRIKARHGHVLSATTKLTM